MHSHRPTLIVELESDADRLKWNVLQRAAGLLAKVPLASVATWLERWRPALSDFEERTERTLSLSLNS